MHTRSISALALFVLILVASACRTPAPAGTVAGTGGGATSAITGVEWLLTHLNGSAVIGSGDRRPQLRLSSRDGELEGHGGCNRFSAPYALEGSSLRLAGTVMITEQECADPQINAQEERFIEALESMDSYGLDGGTLTLYSGDTVLARFARGPR